MNIPFIYLDLAIGGNSTKATFWDLMLSKIRRDYQCGKVKIVRIDGLNKRGG